MPDFRHSPSTGRYHNVSSGRMVSEREVRDAVDRLADLTSQRLADLSERLLRRDLRLADWQAELMAVLKSAHVAAGVVAHGGAASMDAATYGAIGHRLRDEYQHLRDFAQQLADGTQPLDGRVVARAQMYGQGARVAFETIRARDDRERGLDEERNVLHADSSCATCKDQSALGYVPIGILLPIGSRSCLSRCRCTITRRRSGAAESARHLRAVS
jgi:hypothetical protein